MRRRKDHPLDGSRTQLLNQPELTVEKHKSDDRNFFVWHKAGNEKKCPVCKGEAIKLHNLFIKTYKDWIEVEGQGRVVDLHYNFYKYRCLNEDCGRVFAHKIQFASRDDHITYRLENQIAKWVIDGRSYGQIEAQLEKRLSRQAVGQIFHRWVKRKEELRKIQRSPSRLAVISGRLDQECYTLFLNLDEGIRVYDVLYGVDSEKIAATLLKIRIDGKKLVISNFDPVIVDVIKKVLPGVPYVIPAEFWFGLIKEDFKTLAHEILKWNQVNKKEKIILMPPDELGYDTVKLERLMRERPRIKKPYQDFNRLRKMLFDREELWFFNEILEWIDSLEENFRQEVQVAVLQLEQNRPQVEAQLQHWDEVPEGLLLWTSRLEELLAYPKMRTFSEEILKARLLYSAEENLGNWQGVPIEETVAFLETIYGKLEELQDDL